jgi:hypothetical protein
MASPAQPAWVARARAAARSVAAAAARDAAPTSSAATAKNNNNDDDTADSPTPPPPPVLTLLSWNLQLLSVSCGSPAQLAARARRIGAKILALRPDVVCLQEAWDARARAALLAALAPVYAATYSPADGAKCGLVIACRTDAGSGSGSVVSRFEGGAFHRFEGASGAEGWLFDKGAAGALLVLREGAGNGGGGAAKARDESDGAPDGAADGDSGDGDSGSGSACRGACVVLVNTHTQSDYWSPGERCARARAPVHAPFAAPR